MKFDVVLKVCSETVLIIPVRMGGARGGPKGIMGTKSSKRNHEVLESTE